MRNLSGFFAFLLVFSLSYVAVHIYGASFLYRNLLKSSLIRPVFLGLAFFSLFSLFLRRAIDSDLFRLFSLAGYFWMGFILLLVFCFFAGDILILILKGRIKKEFIAYLSIAAAFSVFLFSIYSGLIVPKINRINFYEGDNPLNVRVAFISDIHIDYPFKKNLFLKMLDKIEKEKPDILVIGGDFLDPGFFMKEEEFNRVRNLPCVKIGVLGNHEYYFGLEKSKQVFARAGIMLLKDSSLKLEKVNFIGLSDIRTEGILKEDVKKILLENFKPDKLNILLSHQPLYFKELSQEKKILMLSGHTHKGQIFPFHFFTKLAYKYFNGFYHNAGSSLYVSSGAGTWGPPMRFLSDSEIVIIDL